MSLVFSWSGTVLFYQSSTAVLLWKQPLVPKEVIIITMPLILARVVKCKWRLIIMDLYNPPESRKSKYYFFSACLTKAIRIGNF